MSQPHFAQFVRLELTGFISPKQRTNSPSEARSIFAARTATSRSAAVYACHGEPGAGDTATGCETVNCVLEASDGLIRR